MRFGRLFSPVLCVVVLTFSGMALPALAGEGRKTENVVLVTVDGLRWRELFGGADKSILDLDTRRTEGVRRAFWRETPEQRRAALLPFVWGVMAVRGQVWGNQDKGSVAQVLNGRDFSYPGYNEMLTGFPNPEIVNNDKRPNPNVTVLEWLHRKPAYRGRVAAFSSWDTIPYVLNRERCGFPVMGGWEPIPDKAPTERMKLLNELIVETTRFGSSEELFDSFVSQASLEYLKQHHPRVLMINYGETDYWAHGQKYARYLETAYRTDYFLRKLWDYLQSERQYRDKTTLILTTDHGRGDTPETWPHHGTTLPGSKAVWIAMMGPDTPALGERRDCETVTLGQVAATVADLLGEDYCGAEPRAEKPLK